MKWIFRQFCESDLDLLEGDVVRNIQVNIRMYDGWDE